MRRRCAAALLVVPAIALTACGAEDFPNEDRPAAAVELSAKVSDSRVVVAPDQIGAGLATITVANLSDDEVQLDFDGPNPGATQPIQAGGVGSVSIELEQGDYEVAADDASISSGTLTVGSPRPSAQNELLLP
jgi:hypothetical protein